MIKLVWLGACPTLGTPALSFLMYQEYRFTKKTMSFTMAWVMVALIRGTMVSLALPEASFSHGPPFFLIMPTSWTFPDMMAGTVVMRPMQRVKYPRRVMSRMVEGEENRLVRKAGLTHTVVRA